MWQKGICFSPVGEPRMPSADRGRQLDRKDPKDQNVYQSGGKQNIIKKISYMALFLFRLGLLYNKNMKRSFYLLEIQTIQELVTENKTKAMGQEKPVNLSLYYR